MAKIGSLANSAGPFDRRGRLREAQVLLADFERDLAQEAGRDRRYDYDTCPKCGHQYQLIDWGSAPHQLRCSYPVPLPPSTAAMNEAQQLVSDLRAVGTGDMATDAVTDAAGLGLPLVITGQGDYRREICGDARTGKLIDLRA